MKRLVSSSLFGILVLYFVVPASFANEIYRCQIGKKIEFHDTPCSIDAKQEKLDAQKYPQSIPSAPEAYDVAVPKVLTPKAGKPPMQMTGDNGQIIIDKSVDSHFYIDGFINSVPVRFLVDTGASYVAIPDKLMESMGLQQEETVNVRSATGLVKAYKTTIDELTLGNYTFKNVSAQTMQGSQPLLGMNVLSQFDVTLKDDQLILSNKND